jgi:tetratricopeptide (TPR) repeat protein
VAIKGSLKEASLPDVLQLLSLGAKSGCLSVTDRNSFGYVYFDRGKISYASIVNRRDRLGDILVKNGKISQAQLEAAIDHQGKGRSGKRLGEILVDQNSITRNDLESYMRLQIEEAVYFLFTWTQGNFNFEADVKPEQDFIVSINPESLLLEGARRVDEWSLIEKKIPSLDVIFTVDRERLLASQVHLTDVQEQILPFLDGSRDVATIVEDSGLVEFEVGKALYGLITAGFAHRTGKSAATGRTSDVGDAKVQEHRNLGIAFYKTGMMDEAGREFRRVADLRPTDAGAMFYIGMVGMRQGRWHDAVDAFKQAIERGGERGPAMHNLGLAYERLGLLDDAEQAYGEAVSKSKHDERPMIAWGMVAVQRGDFDVALSRLDRAKELAGERPLPAMWFWSRAVALAATDRLDEAERVLRAGLETYAEHPILSNNLAVLLELSGDVGQAEDLLRAAIAVEPSLPQPSKNLGDILYRAGKYDDAWEAYERAIKHQPKLGDDVYFKLGNIAYKRREKEIAGEMWRRALELNPQHELAKTNLDTMVTS